MPLSEEQRRHLERRLQEERAQALRMLAQSGAVSRECCEAMARGLLVMTPADWGIAVTGIAGPGGGSPEKPVGLVWIGWVHRRGAVE